MSGFIAALGKHANPARTTYLKKASIGMAYRGDQESIDVFSDRAAAVTRHREATGYRTSTYSDRQFAVIFDGFLFNLQELRNAVGAAAQVDVAQVILDGYRQHGDSWFFRLDGSFAVAIMDMMAGETILARDRFAHRPMYFAHIADETWVASEIKAILDVPGYSPALNRNNLPYAISNGMTPGPQTLHVDIHKCVPGFVVHVDQHGKQRNFDYFTPTVKQRSNLTLEESKEYVMSILKTNVDHYLKACPDLAVMLSGGVDSALLAHLTTELSGGKTHAISFGAESWAKEESSDAAALAERLGMDFSRTYVSPDADILGSLRNVVRILEDPTRFENAVALELTSQDAASRYAAVMTGEGADFILGEREHLVASRLDRILQLPAALRTVISKLPLRKLPSKDLRALASFLEWKSIRDYGQRCSANCFDLVPNVESPPINEIVEMLANVTEDWPIQSQYTFMTLREAVHCWIERMEKISAAVGLECFFPFESNDILQFALEIPDELRNSRDASKPILRSLTADIFDHEVAYGEKKQLAAPMSLWLDESEQLRDAVLDLRKPDCRIREYLNMEAGDRYLAQYEKDGASSEAVAVPIFRMLTFDIWLDTFL